MTGRTASRFDLRTRPRPMRPVLQRKCACGQHASSGECEECKKRKSDEKSNRDPLLQRSAVNGTSAVAAKNLAPSIVGDALRSPGQPLDSATRAFFEPRMGQDFSRVRVHDDQRAATSAKSMSAAAYTVGQDLVFASGKYNPACSSGQKLLAHELTHVVQQNSSGSLPVNVLQNLEVGPVRDAFEEEARENERMAGIDAERVRQGVRGYGALPSVEAAPRNAVQRQQNMDQTSSQPATMTRAQFEDVMKRKFQVSSIRTGAFADQRFGDMREAEWQAWPTSSSEAQYASIVEGINNVVARIGGMPPVQNIFFFKVAYDKDLNTPPTNGMDHAIKNPNTGASFATGRLDIFESVARGNEMLDLHGHFQTPTKEQAIRRNISHELGHSTVEQAMFQASRPGVDESIMADYKTAAGWIRGASGKEEVYDAGDSEVQAAVRQGVAPPLAKRITIANLNVTFFEKPLTAYALDNPGDDFAEAFMAYVNEPDVLKKFAPRRFEFIDKRKSRWDTRLVRANQPAAQPNLQQKGAAPSATPNQKRAPNLPLRKDFNREIEKSAEDVGL
jgi:hypothetical protein